MPFEVPFVVHGKEVSDLVGALSVVEARTVPSAVLAMEVYSSNLELVGGLAFANHDRSSCVAEGSFPTLDLVAQRTAMRILIDDVRVYC